MFIFCRIPKTLSSECIDMKDSKWNSKIKLKLKVPQKSVEPRRKQFSAKVMDSREKVRGKRTKRVLRTIREESRKRFTRFAASAERNLISRCWKWWFPEVLGCFARFSHFSHFWLVLVMDFNSLTCFPDQGWSHIAFGWVYSEKQRNANLTPRDGIRIFICIYNFLVTGLEFGAQIKMAKS